jgi:pyruvate/2-oxoglutarate dehydrogenase complex dihydrolipoamide dehydrogenase (E3) component
VVLGAGAAGLTAATGLGSLGARVLLVEKEALGGDCIAWGCVPSKTFLHVARLYRQALTSRECGVECGTVTLDFARARDYVGSVQRELARRDTAEELSRGGIALRYGSARFVGPRALELDGERLDASHFVLATGAHATPPPVEGLSEAGFLDSRSALQLDALPKSLLVLGGGPIGVEFGQMFQRLGVSVTLVESNPRLLPREEPEAGDLLLEILRSEGARFLGERRAVRAWRTPSGKALLLRCRDGTEETVEAEEILVATGRAPNVEGLELERAGVEHAPGGIRVDSAMRTTRRGIWAVGDCNGLYQFTHMAEHEARVCVRNILRSRLLPFWPERMRFKAVAWVTYTDPEVAHCGLTEAEARERGIPHRVLTYTFSGLDRAVIENEPGGLAKILTTPGGRLLGAHMVGVRAGELLQELVLGVRLGLSIQDVSQTVHPYPSFVQMAWRTASMYYVQTVLQNPRRRSLLHRLAGFGRR